VSVHRYVERDAERAAAACARHILNCLEQAVAGHGQATFAASGFKSPVPVFRALAASGFDWSRVYLFWADERCVPPYHEQSNFRVVDQNLVIPARIPRRNVHRVYTELGAQRAASRYAEDIAAVFGLEAGQLPAFDLIHLGMGPDGHIASLFPGDVLVNDRTGIAGAAYHAGSRMWRVTLLPGVLIEARHTVVYAPGADKAGTIRSVFEEDFDPFRLPAQIPAHLARSVSWFSDEAEDALVHSAVAADQHGGS
jgi:6-phosphogluconolactonase